MLYPVAGIVAEYNPLHKGHLYHIQKARELCSAEAVAAAQRALEFAEPDGVATAELQCFPFSPPISSSAANRPCWINGQERRPPSAAASISFSSCP